MTCADCKNMRVTIPLKLDPKRTLDYKKSTATSQKKVSRKVRNGFAGRVGGKVIQKTRRRNEE